MVGRNRETDAVCLLLVPEPFIKVFMSVNLWGESHVVEMPVK